MTKIIRKLDVWCKRQAKQRRTVKELSALSDRDLSDIGISRCDIPRISRDGRI